MRRGVIGAREPSRNPRCEEKVQGLVPSAPPPLESLGKAPFVARRKGLKPNPLGYEFFRGDFTAEAGQRLRITETP